MNENTNHVNEENMEYPVLVLSQQPDSHSFNDRRIVLSDTIKVGRSVARARPSDVNGIFDCKVLSRNHAILWFDNGKVWLKDTKSSNGTYVNNALLSKGTEESPPREIYSGDIIQFGVEVVENTTTHGCIVAQVTAFMPDGSEIRRQSDMMNNISPGITNPGNGIPISNYYEEQIYQLAQYIQEASHREQTLEKKLQSLSQLILDTQEASDSSWRVILNQDRLLEKLQMLQDQVELYASMGGGDDAENDDGVEQNSDDDDDKTQCSNKPPNFHGRLKILIKEKYDIERQSKSLLENLANEKCEVLQRVMDLEQRLSSSQDECAHLQMTLESIQTEHEEQGRLANERQQKDQELAMIQLKEAQQESLEQKKQFELETLRLEIECRQMKERIEELEEAKTAKEMEDAKYEMEKLKESSSKEDLSLKQHDKVEEDLDRLVGSISGDMTNRLSQINDEKSKQEEIEDHLIQEVGRLQDFLDEISCNDDAADEKKKLIDHVDVANQATEDKDPGSDMAVQTEFEEKIKLVENNSLVEKLEQMKAQMTAEKCIADNLRTELLSIQATRLLDRVTIEKKDIEHVKLLNERVLLDKKCRKLEVNFENITAELNRYKEAQYSREQKCSKCINTDTASQNIADINLSTNDDGRAIELKKECEQLRDKVIRIEADLEKQNQKSQSDVSLLQQTVNSQKSKIKELELDLERVRSVEEYQNERQQLITRARRISGFSMVPLIVLMTGLILALISFIAKPFFNVPTTPN